MDTSFARAKAVASAAKQEERFRKMAAGRIRRAEVASVSGIWVTCTDGTKAARLRGAPIWVGDEVYLGNVSDNPKKPAWFCFGSVGTPDVSGWTDATTNTTSSTAAPLANLSFTAPANSRWRVEWSFSTYCYNGDGMKFGVGGPSGASLGVIVRASTTGPTALTHQKLTTIGTMTQTLCATGSNNGFVHIIGIVTIGSTAGDVQLLWAAATNGQNNAIDTRANLLAIRQA